MTLTNKAVKGVVWVAIERGGYQIIQATILIVLARLLTPSDFGLIAMLMVFFAIANSFIESGMGQALIREDKISDNDRSTVFWFNLLLSIAFYALLFVTAPLIAGFYEQPKLIDLTRFMGLSIIFFGFAVVQRAELTQKLEFKKQAIAQVPAAIIAGISSVSMAYFGMGVWALATQYILIALLSSIMLWILQPARIKLSFNKESFSRLFGFGYKLLISGLINTAFKQLYNIIIGKIYDAAILGLYSQAQKLLDIITKTLVNVIQKVSYPVLSKYKNDKSKLRKGYQIVLQSSSFILFPSIITILFYATPILTLILGEHWAPASPYLKLLCISALLYHLHAINLNILKVVGRSDLFLKLEIIKKAVITVAVLIGINFGVIGLIIGQVVSSYIGLAINTYYTSIFLEYKFSTQLVDISKVLIYSVPISIIYFGLDMIISTSELIGLVIHLSIQVLSYLIISLIIRAEFIKDLLSYISPYMPLKMKSILHL